MEQRIQLILQTKDLTPTRFADEIGVQRSSVSHILSGRNGPSLDFVQKVLKRYPDIGAEWLVTGNGVMYPNELADIADERSKAKKKAVVDLFSDEAAKETPVIEPPYTPDAIQGAVQEAMDIPASDGAQKIPPAVRRGGIERILILYSDGSFSSYEPGN